MWILCCQINWRHKLDKNKVWMFLPGVNEEWLVLTETLLYLYALSVIPPSLIAVCMKKQGTFPSVKKLLQQFQFLLLCFVWTLFSLYFALYSYVFRKYCWSDLVLLLSQISLAFPLKIMSNTFILPFKVWGRQFFFLFV